MGTKIDYVDESWNPFQDVHKGKSGRGYHCTKVSPGCDNCWAERFNNRFGNKIPFDDAPAKLELVEKELTRPQRWTRKRRRVLFQAMGDIFHGGVDWLDIDKVLLICALCPEHHFFLLTKRSNPAWYYLVNRPTGEYLKRKYRVMREVSKFKIKELPLEMEWPLPNLWLGITAEDQERFNERWNILKQIPAAGYFISHEPALGPIEYPDDFLSLGIRALVITGGEAGPGSRPMHPDWVRRDRAQCVLPGVHFFFKQWGDWSPCVPDKKTISYDFDHPYHNFRVYRVGKKKAGRLLGGREWNELPVMPPLPDCPF